MELLREFKKIDEEFKKRFEMSFDFLLRDSLFNPTLFTLINGTDAVLDDLFSYQIANKFKNNWYGATAPSDIQNGMIWVDSDDGKVYRHHSGADAALLLNLVEDTTPQLGGDLDLNGKNIDFPTTPNISDCLDEDNMASNSATKLATQQSIKAYVDASSRSYRGSFTRDLTAASGDVAYTGVGFQGDFIVFWMRLPGNANVSCIGWDWASSTARQCYFNDTVRGNVLTPEHSYSITAMQGATPDYQSAFIKSFDADGFTITWIKANSPTGTITVYYTIFKQ